MTKEDIRGFIRFNKNLPLFRVKQIFLQRGYPPQEIDEVISEFMPQSSSAKPKHERKYLAITIIGIILLGIAIFLLVFLLQSGKPDQLLDLKIISLDEQIHQGDNLKFNIEVLNLGKQEQYDITLTYDILNMQGQYYPRLRSERTVAIQDKSEFPGAIEKINLKPGDYKFSVIARYSNQVASASQVFEVLAQENPSDEESASQEQTAENSETTNTAQSSSEDCGNCNDNDKCTQDLCESGLCVHNPVENCCGNNICESSESSSSCSLDCIQKITGYSDDDLETKALAVSATNPAEAIRYCLSISIQENINYCLNVCADKSQKQEFCSKMSNQDMKDNCFMTLSINGKPELCKFITNGYKKNTCLALS